MRVSQLQWEQLPHKLVMACVMARRREPTVYVQSWWLQPDVKREAQLASLAEGMVVYGNHM